MCFVKQQEAEDRARLEWLRSAARDGFSAIERNEGTKFPSIDDLDAQAAPPAQR